MRHERIVYDLLVFGVGKEESVTIGFGTFSSSENVIHFIFLAITV